jgi:hypothetical protein
MIYFNNRLYLWRPYILIKHCNRSRNKYQQWQSKSDRFYTSDFSPYFTMYFFLTVGYFVNIVVLCSLMVIMLAIVSKIRGFRPG